eukprot:g6144.t1
MAFSLYSTLPRYLLNSQHRRRTLLVHGSLSDEEIKIRVRKARNLIRYWDKLVPYDKKAFNGAKLLWECLEDIPSDERHSLLPLLNSRDVRRIWKISSDRYKDNQSTNSPFLDFPDEPHQIVHFEGRNATWIVKNCSRVLFMEEDGFELLGRAIYPFDQITKSTYPLYFKLNLKSGRIPATGEIYDFSFEYLMKAETSITSKDQSPDFWPEAKDPVFPFNGRLTEYIRCVGPGCYVGIGWKAPRPEFNDLGRRFLTFVLIRV